MAKFDSYQDVTDAIIKQLEALPLAMQLHLAALALENARAQIKG